MSFNLKDCSYKLIKQKMGDKNIINRFMIALNDEISCFKHFVRAK